MPTILDNTHNSQTTVAKIGIAKNSWNNESELPLKIKNSLDLKKVEKIKIGSPNPKPRKKNINKVIKKGWDNEKPKADPINGPVHGDAINTSKAPET